MVNIRKRAKKKPLTDVISDIDIASVEDAVHGLKEKILQQFGEAKLDDSFIRISLNDLGKNESLFSTLMYYFDSTLQNSCSRSWQNTLPLAIRSRVSKLWMESIQKSLTSSFNLFRKVCPVNCIAADGICGYRADLYLQQRSKMPAIDVPDFDLFNEGTRGIFTLELKKRLAIMDESRFTDMKFNKEVKEGLNKVIRWINSSEGYACKRSNNPTLPSSSNAWFDFEWSYIFDRMANELKYVRTLFVPFEIDRDCDGFIKPKDFSFNKTGRGWASGDWCKLSNSSLADKPIGAGLSFSELFRICKTPNYYMFNHHLSHFFMVKNPNNLTECSSLLKALEDLCGKIVALVSPIVLSLSRKGMSLTRIMEVWPTSSDDFIVSPFGTSPPSCSISSASPNMSTGGEDLSCQVALDIINNKRSLLDDICMLALPFDVVSCLLMFLPPLLQYIPDKLIGRMRDLMTVYLNNAESCLLADNVDEAILFYKKFLSAILGLRSDEAEDREASKKGMSNRLAYLLETDDWRDVRFGSFQSLGGMMSNSNNNVKRHVFKICGVDLTYDQLKAWKLLEQGLVSKAFQSLKPSGIPLDSKKAVATLNKLHPKRSPIFADILPPINVTPPASVPQELFSSEQVFNYFASRDKLVSPGLSKLRNEHVKQLIGKDVDGTFASSLSLFLSRIASASLPKPVLRFLSQSALIPFYKVAGDCDNLRPIVLGDTLKKAAATLLLGKHRVSIDNFFGSDQVGVGFRSGAELIYHSHSIHRQLFGEAQDFVAIDATNAFNTVNRNIMLSSIKAHFPDLLAYIQEFYGEASLLLYRGIDGNGNIIISDEGVQQGDPMGPFAYSVAVNSLYQQVKHLTGPHGLFKAFIDDASYQTDVNCSIQSLKFLMSEGPSYGYHVNPAKTRIMLADNITNDEYASRRQRYADALGLTVEQCTQLGVFVEGVKLMGVPFGSEQYVSSWLKCRLNELEGEASIIAQYPDPQKAWKLLYYVFKVKFQHLYRCLPYQLLAGHAKHFEELCFYVLESIIGQRLFENSSAMIQCRMPMNYGGLSFGFLDLTAHAAYISSVTSVLPFLPHLDNLDTPLCPWWHYLQSSLNYVNLIVTSEVQSFNNINIEASPLLQVFDLHGQRGLSITKLGELYNFKKLQHALYSLMIRPKVMSFLDDSTSPEEAERRVNINNKFSSSFLQAVPFGACRLDKTQFRNALSHLLGLEYNFIPFNVKCSCSGHPIIDKHGNHLSCCVKGGGWTNRHNVVVNEVKALVESAGLKVILEPRNCFTRQNPLSKSDDAMRRPDLKIYNPGKLKYSDKIGGDCPRDLLLDIMVTHGATSELEKGFKGKNQKYKALAESNNCDFSPLIANTLGVLHDDFDNFIRSMAHKIWEKSISSVTEPVLYNYWKKRLVCAIVKAQSNMLVFKMNYIIDTTNYSSCRDECAMPGVVDASNVAWSI